MLSLLKRFPLTFAFLISLFPLVWYVRPGSDTAMPQVVEWLMLPAYFLTFLVSISGLRRPANMLVAIGLVVLLDYLLWTVLARRSRSRAQAH
jgi:hypothetical protein